MNHANGWMGAGMIGEMWLWTVIGILVGILLFVMIKNNHSWAGLQRMGETAPHKFAEVFTPTVRLWICL